MTVRESLKAFEEAAYLYGGICRQRIMASARLAIVAAPNNWPAVLASLRKWRPEFFSEEAAHERQSHNDRRQSASNRQPPVSCGNGRLEKCTI